MGTVFNVKTTNTKSHTNNNNVLLPRRRLPIRVDFQPIRHFLANKSTDQKTAGVLSLFLAVAVVTHARDTAGKHEQQQAATI